MSDDKVIMLDSYRPAPPERYPPEFRSLRGWISALWPSALFLAFMVAGEYLIGGIVHQALWVVISLAMVAWSVFGILSPRAQDWLDPVVDAEAIARNRRNTRQWSIASLLLWILIAGYTIFNLILSE